MEEKLLEIKSKEQLDILYQHIPIGFLMKNFSSNIDLEEEEILKLVKN